VRILYQSELEVMKERLTLLWYGREEESDHPRYYLQYDPEEDTRKGVDRVVKAINESQGPAQKAGRKPQGDLLRAMCAFLLGKPGWSSELLADRLQMSAKRVRELAREG
jgi:hypothetical protein